jgi:hypothetical protein
MPNNAGSYVDQRLMPGETVLFRTQEHWTARMGSISLAFVFSLLGLVLLLVLLPIPAAARPVSAGWGVGCLIFAVAAFVAGKIYHQSHEYAVTDRRILFCTPMQTYDVLLNRLEAVNVSEAFFGSYGSVMIRSAGVTEVFEKVNYCVQLARTIEAQMRKLVEQPQAVYVVPTPPPAGAAK